MAKQRKYTYAIIHLPKTLLREAEDAHKTLNSPSKIILSSEFCCNIKEQFEEGNPHQIHSREGEKQVTLNIPITETNRHTKLTNTHEVNIDLYYLEEGGDE